jgi:hypothetical protein
MEGKIVKVIFIRKYTKCCSAAIDGFHMRHYNGVRLLGRRGRRLLTGVLIMLTHNFGRCHDIKLGV